MVEENHHQYQHPYRYHPGQNPPIFQGGGAPPPPPPPFRGGGVSQRGRSRAGRRTNPTNQSSSSMMAGFVDRVMSPFVQCWQPPLNACVSTGMPMASCGGSRPIAPVPSPSNANAGHAHPHSGPIVTPMSSRRGVSPHPHHPAEAPVSVRTPVAMTSASAEATPPSSRPLENIETPIRQDVLCGRGGNSNRHNVYFRELVAANKPSYANLTKKQKMLVSRNIVDLIHQSGGRFLCKDTETGLWKDVGMPRSLEKASQALREKVTTGIMGDATNTTMQQQQQQQQQSEVPKLNPRTVVAPPLIVPPHLKEIYRPRPRELSPAATTTTATSADHRPSHVPAYQPTTPVYHRPLPTSRPSMSHPYDEDDDGSNMPAPHRGAFPFHARHMPRVSNSLTPSQATPSYSRPLHPAVAEQPPLPPWKATFDAMDTQAPASPVTTPAQHRWQPFPSTGSFSPGNASTVPSMASTAVSSSTTSGSSTTNQNSNNNNVLHSPPAMVPPVFKRQKTDDEEEEEETENTRPAFLPQSEGGDDNGEPFSLQDTSLPEGSEYLPPSEMGKLSLKERVVGAPVPAATARQESADNLMMSPSAVCLPRSRRSFGQNHSHSSHSSTTDDHGMAGLAALSTAAFLRLDESGSS